MTVQAQYRQRRGDIRALIQSFKKDKKCSRCGFDDPHALDFHHRDAGQKDFRIALAVSGNYSRERILAEIAKCDVLCANCHRILHAEE